MAFGNPGVAAAQAATRDMPIVAMADDLVAVGLVPSMARPGGNTTGFSSFEYSLSGKWLELLKEIAPNLTRIAVLRDPALAAGIGQFAVIQAMMPPSFGVELTTIDGRDPGEVELDVTAFAREPNGGLIVTASPSAVTHRDRMISHSNCSHGVRKREKGLNRISDRIARLTKSKETQCECSRANDVVERHRVHRAAAADYRR